MEAKDKIQEISDERNGLRQEIIATEQALQRCVFAGVAAAAILAGVYWHPGLIAQPDVRGIVLAVINQLIFGLVALAVMNMAGIFGIGNYIAVLEHKINLLAEDTITGWESKIVPEVVWNSKSPAFWTAVLFDFWLFCLFVGSSFLALRVINNPAFILLVLIEALIVVLLLRWTIVHRKRARQIMMKELGLVTGLRGEPQDIDGTRQPAGGDSGTRAEDGTTSREPQP